MHRHDLRVCMIQHMTCQYCIRRGFSTTYIRRKKNLGYSTGKKCLQGGSNVYKNEMPPEPRQFYDHCFGARAEDDLSRSVQGTAPETAPVYRHSQLAAPPRNVTLEPANKFAVKYHSQRV